MTAVGLVVAAVGGMARPADRQCGAAERVQRSIRRGGLDDLLHREAEEEGHRDVVDGETQRTGQSLV